MQSEIKRIKQKTFVSLDETDRRILREVQARPKARTAEIARAVNLSAPAAAERLRRLEESGVLTYRAEIDPAALGYGVCVFVRVKPKGRDLNMMREIAREVPEVTEYYRITGEDCCLMRIYVRSVDDLERVLDNFTPHGHTTTSIIVNTFIAPRALPIQ